MSLSWSSPAGPDVPGEMLATPFEEWCAARGIHPDAIGAWECFEACHGQSAIAEPA